MKRPIIQAFAVGLLLVLAVSSIALACSAQPTVIAMEVLGPSGTNLLLKGEGFPAQAPDITPESASQDSAPVRIYWNSANGPQLAAAYPDDGGRFSVPVVIPQAKPGVYFLVASLHGFGVARTPFEVTGSAEAAGSASATVASADLWSGLEASRPDSASLAAASEEHAAGPAAGVALVGLGGTLAVSALLLGPRLRRRGLAS